MDGGNCNSIPLRVQWNFLVAKEQTGLRGIGGDLERNGEWPGLARVPRNLASILARPQLSLELLLTPPGDQ